MTDSSASIRFSAVRVRSGAAWRLGWLLCWPALALAADAMVRFRDLAGFGAVDWGCYAASAVLGAGLWWLAARGLLWLWRTGKKRLYRVALAALCLVSVALPAIGYGCYLANGDLPDLFLLSFVRCEPANAWILARAAVGPAHILGLLAGVAALVFWTDRWRRMEAAAPRPRRRTVALVALAAWLALWACWSATVSRGKCFTPTVRIPLITAMYLHNEVKGINPKPIRLPARQALEIHARIPRPPVNVLLVLNESLRPRNMALYGHRRENTPFMKEWQDAEPGNFLKFERAFSNSTSTLLSVPSILTGIATVQPMELKTTAPLLWQWAATAGAHSFYFTSHDPDWMGLGPFLTTPPPEACWDRRSAGHPPYRDMGCDDHFTVDHAVDHIASLAGNPRPFVGVVHLNTNHYPYNTRPEFRRWSGGAEDLYDNTILETDAHVRRLVEALEKASLLDHTVVIFASDHGEAFNEHGYIAHFYCHYVETISVPLWLRLPPGFAAGRDLTALRHNLGAYVQNLDILPTILDCIGAWEHPELAEFRRPLTGSSLFRPLPEEREFWITNTDEAMPSETGLSSVRGRWHYMLRASQRPPREELYDLEADPEERNDLWPATPAAEKERRRRSFLRFPESARMMLRAFPELENP